MRQAWIYGLVLASVGVIGFVVSSKSSKDDEGTPGFEDLLPCTLLTSIDSQKSLYLNSHHEAKFSDKSGSGTRWETGTWELVDDDNHIYKISVDGSARDFTLVSAPAGEGCMLAAGGLQSVDLTKSWFSALTDPK